MPPARHPKPVQAFDQLLLNHLLHRLVERHAPFPRGKYGDRERGNSCMSGICSLNVYTVHE